MRLREVQPRSNRSLPRSESPRHNLPGLDRPCGELFHREEFVIRRAGRVVEFFRRAVNSARYGAAEQEQTHGLRCGRRRPEALPLRVTSRTWRVNKDGCWAWEVRADAAMSPNAIRARSGEDRTPKDMNVSFALRLIVWLSRGIGLPACMVRAIRVRKLYKDENNPVIFGRGAQRANPQNASYSAFPLRRLCGIPRNALALAGDAAKIGHWLVNVQFPSPTRRTARAVASHVASQADGAERRRVVHKALQTSQAARKPVSSGRRRLGQVQARFISPEELMANAICRLGI